MPKRPQQTLGKVKHHPHKGDWRRRGWKLKFILFSFLLLAPSASSIGAQTPDQTSKPASPSDKKLALAEVNGKAVTLEEVEGALGAQLAQLEEQIYQLKRQRLESLIAERLLDQEAVRRGVTTRALLDTEVTAKAATVTDQDIENFYQANKVRIGGALDATKRSRIMSYLQNQRLDARREEFLQTLRSQAKVIINLPTPQFRLKASTEGAPFRGGSQAPVTIIEFSDFHCPFCSKVQTTLAQALARYGEKVKLVYRHFPIDQLHPQARKAAEAAVCAQEQKKFWDYHDRLYSGGPDASPERLKAIAQAVGLDAAAFESCLASGRVKTAVHKDVEEAVRLGMTGTPAFLINGRMLSGAQPLENFIRVIEEELGPGREATVMKEPGSPMTRESLTASQPKQQEVATKQPEDAGQTAAGQRSQPKQQEVATKQSAPSLQQTIPQESGKQRVASGKPAQEKVYTNDKAGYVLTYPLHWFASDTVYANAFELRNYDPKNPQSVPERNQAILVVVETINDSAEVTEKFLDDLKPQPPFGLTHLTIDGHRAVRLTRRVNERSLGPGALRTSTVKPSNAPRSYFLIETYIARGRSLLSIQATMPVEADSSVIAEATGIGEKLKFLRTTGNR